VFVAIFIYFKTARITPKIIVFTVIFGISDSNIALFVQSRHSFNAWMQFINV